MTTREERLRIVARGRCSAASRTFGPRVKYLPAIDGMIAQLSEEEDDCFDTSKEAVAAAKRFRDEARAKLHEEFGEP
ncbi:hypothetical protein V1279_003100 [Bradyrhizobium sp. AZCC 1610]|uniref:hypothetical protein n=1 Tax=Bradyrhizobium sp. AZCC 1610 TaxID=3117020 RepID=UPI002FEF6061